MSDDGSMRRDKRKLTTTAKEGYVSFGHPSVTVTMSSGERVAIDVGIVDLVVLMNGIPGIETKGSCQGEGSNYGYVQFMPDGTQGRAHASLYFMHHILRNMHSAGCWTGKRCTSTWSRPAQNIQMPISSSSLLSLAMDMY